MALCLEGFKVVLYSATEEGAALFQRWLIDDYLCTLCLDTFHDTLDGRLSEVITVSVQKCQNAPIFKFLSLKISLIQADCHWKQVLEQRPLALYGLGTYRSFCCQIIYGIFTIVSIGEDLLPKLMEIITANSLFHSKDPNEEERYHSPSLYAPWHPSPVLLPTDGSSFWHLPTGSQQFPAFSLYR